MAKLIALALAFAALVAFATAHTTIMTTTIEDENPVSRQRQCSQRLQGQRFNQCRMHLQQGQGPYEEENRQIRGQELEQCCEELQNVEEQCQCEAVKHVFREVQQQHQIGPFGSQQTQRLRQRAEMLPNQCNLQSRQCRIGSVMTTTTTISDSDSDESNIDIPFWSRGGSDSQQCRESEIQRPVNQCQRYVQQQMRSPRSTLLMSVNRRQGQQSQGIQQCCDELQNIRTECQCQAIEEVARQVMRQQQQQGGRRQYRGQQEDQTQIVRRVVQNMPNQCDLDVRQCNIPY
ncbi:hypothetical protein SSX86_024412 [Deinandra increscens subsp. villosa]|uniref:Bifunctional inhibitor/plant lipid transfer protein/seed storage helical domain-containing protein n=1 Tax=Deinandra increscens subsp. villosa TaxID=3103831 RepID=A0AAP0GPL7_9ASTR